MMVLRPWQPPSREQLGPNLNPEAMGPWEEEAAWWRKWVPCWRGGKTTESYSTIVSFFFLIFINTKNRIFFVLKEKNRRERLLTRTWPEICECPRAFTAFCVLLSVRICVLTKFIVLTPCNFSLRYKSPTSEIPSGPRVCLCVRISGVFISPAYLTRPNCSNICSALLSCGHVSHIRWN